MTQPRRKPGPAKVTAVQPNPNSSAISNPLIFVSHDTRDADLAEAFSKLLSSVSAGMLKSFRSSDRKGSEGIEYGVDWYPEVMGKIELACDVVCLLTPRSVERPWILYEAGVAKGKLNTPVHGIALGIPLAKAAVGPFAQFQNCDDDQASLQKLILQLMRRVSGAEPDADTVAMQVNAFKSKAASALEQIGKKNQADQLESRNVEESSVAKLFEEVKLMFHDLPGRIDSRSHKSMRNRLRHFNPNVIYELSQGGPGDENLALVMIASYFRDDAPWIYELALQTYRATQSGTDEVVQRSLRNLLSAVEITAHHPMFRELIRGGDDVMMLLIETERLLRSFPVGRSVQRIPGKKKVEGS